MSVSPTVTRCSTLVALALAAALLLAGCNTGTGDNGTPDGPDRAQVEQATEAMVADIGALTNALQQDPALLALGGLPSLPFGPTPLPLALPQTVSSDPLTTVLRDPLQLLHARSLRVAAAAAAAPAPQQNEAQALPRGVFEHDPVTDSWNPAGASDDLVLRWTASDGTTTLPAELILDWNAISPTETVLDPNSGLPLELFTGMTARLLVTAGGAALTVADLDVTAAWLDCAPLNGKVLEPTALGVDGFIGGAARLEINDVQLALTGGTLTTSGELKVRDDPDFAALAWDVTLQGTVQRDAETCVFQDFALQSGQLSADLSASAEGEQHALGLTLNFDGLVFDESNIPLSADIDGSVRLDGATAFTFAGTLDDADADGIPGENVTVTYNDGTTSTLEEFLEATTQEPPPADPAALGR